MIRDPSGDATSDMTESLAAGAQVCRAPSAVLNAARKDRACCGSEGLEDADFRKPPTYTTDAVTVMADTRELVTGVNVVTSAPVAVSNAAMCERVMPSTVVKSPPT